jgi:SAM-dependent methyltransferase
MNDFTADWLTLREPADRAARNRVLSGRLAGLLQNRPSVTVVDLGAGTGSTARALAPDLPGPQTWRLVDHDAGLLAAARDRLAAVTDRDGRSIAVSTVVADLAAGVPPEALDGADLIACSAFLDLVGRPFMDRFAQAAKNAGAIVYCALTVDGRLSATPADPLDTAVFKAFNVHMGRDKGFGPALGPKAPDMIVHILRMRGYRVEAGHSDWTVDAATPELARRLVGGWAGAAGETGLVDAEALARWTERRLGEIDAGEATFVVGHLDILGIPV